MTVQVDDRRKDYVGNGVAVSYPGPRAFTKAQIQVYKGPGGVLAFVPQSQYEVNGLGSPGTTVVFNAAPANGYAVVILRTVLFDQPTDVTNLGQFLPEIHENAFDYRCFQIQQLSEGSMQMEFDPETGAFVWNAKGSRIVNVGDARLEQDAVNLRTLNTVIQEGPTGPGSGVAPVKFDFLGDGVTTDFLLAGSQVDDPLFYDACMELTAGSRDFGAVEPGQDFTIVPGASSTERYLRFYTAPGSGVEGFAILRGYARSSSVEFVQSLNFPTFTEAGTAAEIDTSKRWGMVETTSNSPVALTIRANTGSATDWRTGAWFGVCQKGDGGVTIASTGITLIVPAGYQAKTRAKGSSIWARCSFADADVWFLSGDLMAAAATPEYVVIQITDRAALSGTNLAVGVDRGKFTMPFGMILRPIADGGVYADVMVAQAAGAVLTFDVNRNGTSILATKLTFDNTEKTTRTAATPAVYATSGDVLAAGDEITWDVDAVGTALAKGGAVYLVGQRAS